MTLRLYLIFLISLWRRNNSHQVSLQNSMLPLIKKTLLTSQPLLPKSITSETKLMKSRTFGMLQSLMQLNIRIKIRTPINLPPQIKFKLYSMRLSITLAILLAQDMSRDFKLKLKIYKRSLTSFLILLNNGKNANVIGFIQKIYSLLLKLGGLGKEISLILIR